MKASGRALGTFFLGVAALLHGATSAPHTRSYWGPHTPLYVASVVNCGSLADGVELEGTVTFVRPIICDTPKVGVYGAYIHTTTEACVSYVYPSSCTVVVFLFVVTSKTGIVRTEISQLVYVRTSISQREVCVFDVVRCCVL